MIRRGVSARAPRRGQRGFNLLEALVAMAIAAIAFTALYRTVLKDLDPALDVQGEWDNLEVQTSHSDSKRLREMIERMRCIPGIAHFLEVHEYPLGDFDDVLDKCRQHFGSQLPGKIFSVRCWW